MKTNLDIFYKIDTIHKITPNDTQYSKTKLNQNISNRQFITNHIVTTSAAWQLTSLLIAVYRGGGRYRTNGVRLVCPASVDPRAGAQAPADAPSIYNFMFPVRPSLLPMQAVVPC